MKKIKTNKGITLIVLVLTIILIGILTAVTITSTDTGTDFRKYSLICSDVKMLEEKILYFYNQYEKLPIGNEITNLPEKIKNGHAFYEINMNLLDNITLNLGSDEDVYIVDSVTFEVYHLNGIEYDGEIYYTD